uniref:ADAM metallopeptidase with thrombospondin type 1 motif 7 n=1 Tax=Strix occidentalis caurina TaxID=311401 RepID=A0A8D0EJV5_STROC
RFPSAAPRFPLPASRLPPGFPSAPPGRSTAHPGEPALPYSSSDIVHPIKVDESGSFLSYDLSHRVLHRRSPSPRSKSLAFYELHYKGQPLKFNLSLNNNLLAPGFVSERRYGGIATAKIQSHAYNSCHMIGEVRSRALPGGLAALSTCDGLKGVFQLMNEDYFIEPVSTSFQEDGAAQPHRIYKRQAPEHGAEQGRRPPAPRETCGMQGIVPFLLSEKRRERWEQKQHRKRRIRQRSISKEKWVETLVVADTKMIEYHGSENIEKYVLTVMNMVAGLFHHASIGNPINIAIVRLILLEDEEEDLKISHHADNTLKSFCKWQKSINVKGDSHPLHHDVAVLLTRKDICAAMNRPCETLGLSHVAGMCQPHRSCNINEDTGLPLAFTVAHELGHSFGIQHDGSSNDCEPVGKRPFIMSPQLLYDTSPLTWSRCSREYITRFLDRGWGLCLDDPPAREVLDYPLVPPGVLYDVGHQCRLQYGAYSTFCDDMDSVCNTLWCTVGNTCHSKLDAAVDGTACGENKWCFNGECVPVGYRPNAIDGSWGSWSSWASCSRSCGAGVQSAERQCSNPTPKYGGRYCLGERKRFRICNVRPCPRDKPSFRQVQCSQFNPMLYKGKLYKWTPVPNNSELRTKPAARFLPAALMKNLKQPCQRLDFANVGCDYEIDSNAVEDRCGVCHGDGSTCHTVRKTFEDSEGLGYVDIGIIPVGAREIRIEEVAEAGNFLALRSEDPEKYFLNGGWTIQWNGDYRVAGTTFTYKRTGNWENLTSPGPTVEPVWIQLLFQETNPGVRYQYTIQRPADSENEIEQAEFLWRFGSWTTCTATCGTGVQRQVVHCVEKLAGIVEERYCDALTRPDDQQRTCSEEPCPARWWVGEWQKCSATCGQSGLMKRTVLCIQSVGLDEQRALQQADCQHLSKPDATAPCHRDVPCPSQWAAGNWSECSVTCGNGTQQRPVFCSNSTGAACDPAERPSSETICSLPQCQKKLDNANTDWSGSGSSSREIFNEIHYIPSNHIAKFNPLIPNIPESNDVNVITEEDFSAKKGNVFVDDFYYDYNFINFHEDLSYYPFTEKDTKDMSGSVGEPGSCSEGCASTEGPSNASSEEHEVAGSAGRGRGDSREMGLVVTNSAAPKAKEQEGWSEMPAPEGTAGTHAAPVADEQAHGTERAGLSFPTLWGPGWEIRSRDGGTHPPASPYPAGADRGPVEQAEHPPELRTPTSLSSAPLGQDALVSAMPTAPAHSPPVHPAGASPSESPPAWWTVGVSHPPASSRAGPTSRRAPLSSTVPGRRSPWATPGLFAFIDGDHKLSQPTPPPRWEMEEMEKEEVWLPPSTTVTVTAVPSWEVGNWSEVVPRDFSAGPLDSVLGQSQPRGILRGMRGMGGIGRCRGAGSPRVLQCSATCGVGAIWRTVRCSTGSDDGCAAANKPVPARRCSLRPCSSWRVGNWSKCSRSCGGGVKVRDVHCVDTRDQRLLRPFHCQAVLYKPLAQLPCQSTPCLNWYTSSWRECSESCGGGEQERLVTCPELGRCEETSRPNATRPCNTHPCTTWVMGSWGECTAACGGGIQRRQVKCINTKTGLAEEDSSLCDHEPWPESTQKCNPQDCESSESGFVCERDRLTFGFCQTLRVLGRCHLPTVHLQCCRSCRQHRHRATPDRDRGDERASRR